MDIFEKVDELIAKVEQYLEKSRMKSSDLGAPHHWSDTSEGRAAHGETVKMDRDRCRLLGEHKKHSDMLHVWKVNGLDKHPEYKRVERHVKHLETLYTHKYNGDHPNSDAIHLNHK